MRVTFLLILVCSMAGMAAGGGDDAVKAEMQKLEGTWTVISIERAGKPLTPEELKKQAHQLVIKDATFAWMQGDKEVAKGKIAIDPAKKPKTVDLVLEGPDGATITIPGIYALDKDSLTIATTKATEKRPTDFKTQPGSPQGTAVYKRDK